MIKPVITEKDNVLRELDLAIDAAKLVDHDRVVLTIDQALSIASTHLMILERNRLLSQEVNRLLEIQKRASITFGTSDFYLTFEK